VLSGIGSSKTPEELGILVVVDVPEIFPGEAIQSDADILECLGNTLGPIHHACGTCKMGKVGNDQTMVDSSCRVIGVRGLRVVGASAIPFLPPGHTQATVYMLAEKIADSILKEHHCG